MLPTRCAQVLLLIGLAWAESELGPHGVLRYTTLGDIFGINADPNDVINVSDCTDHFNQEDTGLNYDGNGGYRTTFCSTECDETEFADGGGCWKTGVNAEVPICLAAKQAGVPVGSWFTTYFFPYTVLDLPGCNESGVYGAAEDDTENNYMIVEQSQIGNMSGVVMNDSGVSMPDIFTIVDCTYSGEYGQNVASGIGPLDENGYFGYRSAFTWYEMVCAVDCSAGDVPEAAHGCPITDASMLLPYCVGASMLGIPAGQPFVVAYRDMVSQNFSGCEMNGILVNSTPAPYDDLVDRGWRIRAVNWAGWTTTSTTTMTSTVTVTVTTSMTSTVTATTSTVTTSTVTTSTVPTSTLTVTTSSVTVTTSTVTVVTSTVMTSTATQWVMTTLTIDEGIAGTAFVSRPGSTVVVLIFWVLRLSI